MTEEVDFNYGIPTEPMELEEWLSRQPPELRETARLFPLNQPIYYRERTFYCVGYTPEGELVCIAHEPKSLTLDQFRHQVEQHAFLFYPKAILDIVTRH